MRTRLENTVTRAAYAAAAATGGSEVSGEKSQSPSELHASAASRPAAERNVREKREIERPVVGARPAHAPRPRTRLSIR